MRLDLIFLYVPVGIAGPDGLFVPFICSDLSCLTHFIAEYLTVTHFAGIGGVPYCIYDKIFPFFRRYHYLKLDLGKQIELDFKAPDDQGGGTTEDINNIRKKFDNE